MNLQGYDCHIIRKTVICIHHARFHNIVGFPTALVLQEQYYNCRNNNMKILKKQAERTIQIYLMSKTKKKG